MEDKDFAWDDDKAARNWRDHASSFEMAREAFRDPFASEWEDTAQGRNEERHSLIGMVENRLLLVGYTIWDGKIRIITARKAEPYERRRRMKKTDKHDWSRFDALTDAEAHAAALADPDAQPLTEERLAHMKRVPRARTLRRALGLTQEEFATRYHIPIGTLRDWEQGRSEPDQPARAYLKVIATDPDGVRRALEAKPG
jgi:putative transcriptional regulator